MDSHETSAQGFATLEVLQGTPKRPMLGVNFLAAIEEARMCNPSHGTYQPPSVFKQGSAFWGTQFLIQGYDCWDKPY